jgi:hypothetical protein
VAGDNSSQLRSNAAFGKRQSRRNHRLAFCAALPSNGESRPLSKPRSRKAFQTPSFATVAETCDVHPKQ